MMADIVLVHGIAQENKNAEELEQAWLPTLAKGVVAAGFPNIAHRIWSFEEGRGDIDVRMAFYGDLFKEAGQQGSGSGPLNDPELAEQLAVEWLKHAAARATNNDQRALARRELNLMQGDVAGAQGPREVARVAVKSLCKVRWFAPYGMSFAENFVWDALSQVTNYMTDEAIRQDAKDTVKALIGPETQIVIGHSLGSVVAFETVHELQQPLPLFITLGSPLGLDTIIYPRLRPQPPSFPKNVKRWVNVADEDDFVAAEPNLTKLFAEQIPAGAVFEGGYTVDNGSKPHSSDFYLSQIEVGRPVSHVLENVN